MTRTKRNKVINSGEPIYIGIDSRLIGAAGLSVLAHLEDLVARGKVVTEGPPSIAGHYRLA